MKVDDEEVNERRHGVVPPSREYFYYIYCKGSAYRCINSSLPI